MTTRYRVEYALKTHRRDQLIEWIKGLLAVPFVLHSQPTAVSEESQGNVTQKASTAHRRYAEILRDVEALINDHSTPESQLTSSDRCLQIRHFTVAHQKAGTPERSKLKLLVPSVGSFFTPLLLEEAFIYQDRKRSISSRRFVAPSFNDVRLTLNTAQIMSLVRSGPLQLITFDGDVTLYDDGESFTDDNPVIPRILSLLGQGTKIGIVTAAGYTDATKYYDRLHGLLDAVQTSKLKPQHKQGLIVLGGESNYLFKFSSSAPSLLEFVPRNAWLLEEMKLWTEKDITELLDVAEGSLRESVNNMRLPAVVLRKERAVGIIPEEGRKFTREQLEETVMVTQDILQACPVGKRLPFCAFNGGNDVFVDIGDKSWGVLSCQRFFGGIEGNKSLHVGDQFLSAGANDFKARLACTTAWIACPAETVALLDELALLGKMESERMEGRNEG
ncbi:MAG: IMP 5'-nucleotidase [Candelaria pacifica]|nr:MAG: IMP 5'-nucleotidase [Candelaria pacifica]